MSITVIKLGGSLMHSNALLNWLDCIQQYAQENPVVIVPGGGEFADKVREVQQQIKFDEQTAHRLALLAMSQFGHLLAGLNPKIQIVDDVGKLSSAPGHKLPLLWLPTCLMNDFSEIPARWDYTSDSIALWLAQRLDARQLILVKSAPVNSAKLKLEELVGKGCIDEGFQSVISDFPGKILYLNPEQFELLNDFNGLTQSSLEILR